MTNVQLPEGYELVSGNSLDIASIMTLRASVGWGVESEAIWKECIAKSLASLGVTEVSSGRLVGVGFLTGSVRHAILCDLVVDPVHQGRGIGKAILDCRIEIARGLGVKYIH